MKLCGIVALLLLAAGCATTRVVNLDTGQGTPIVYPAVDTDPIEIDEAGFKSAVAQLVLDMNLSVMHEANTSMATNQRNHVNSWNRNPLRGKSDSPCDPSPRSRKFRVTVHGLGLVEEGLRET